MPKIERDFAIDVPVERVFAYLSDPVKQIEWLPSVVDVRNVRGEGTSQSFSWTYKMMGKTFKGEAEYTEYRSNEWLVYKTRRGIKSTWTWAFKPQGEQTLVTVAIEYHLPVPVLGKLGEMLILRQNEREADQATANIKERLEWRARFKYLRTDALTETINL
jgi:carbon monoxide dehydrogenase subunit G